MITDINGNPYTTVDQDLVLNEIRRHLAEAIRTELTTALSRKGRLHFDTMACLSYLQFAYAWGRSSGRVAELTETEKQRLDDIAAKFVVELAGRIESALSKRMNGKADLDLSGVNRLIDQAYYAGREDGGA